MPMLTLAALCLLVLPPADTARVLLVATTDIHGQVAGIDYTTGDPVPGGLARAATVIDSLRARYPGEVVLVDAGDVIEGNPFASYFGRVAPRDPHPAIDVMNLLGYDAATPGNHEFDYGVPLMNRALSAATFPYVSGNIRVLPADTLALHPYVVVRRNGVRIGIAGFTTPGVMVWDGDKLAGRLRVTPLTRETPGVLRELRKDADLLVVLAHSGLGGLSSYDTTGVGPENDAASLASGAIHPDIVIVGHTHRELIDSVIGGVHFVQPQPNARSLAIVRIILVRGTAGWRPVSIHAERILLDRVAPAARVARRIAEVQNTVLGYVAQNIGETEGAMRAASARVEDTPLLRFINQVQRQASGAQLSAAPVFDIRAGFEPGQIRMGDLFRLYPFENTLRAVRISGDQLRAYLEQSARYFFVDSTGKVFVNAFVPGYNYDVIGGAEYSIDLTRSPGQRITRLSVGGKPVSATDSFSLALSSYRQAGGGNYVMLRGAPVVYDKGENIRDLLIAEIRRRKTLDAASFAGSSWNIVPETAARQARALFVREGGPPAPATAAASLRLPPPRSVNDSAGPVLLSGSNVPPVARLSIPAPAGAGGSLLRLLADAYKNALRADLALVALDEAAQALPSGPVDSAQVSGSVMAGQHLLRLSMSGKQLREVFEHVVEADGPCCEVSGVTVTYSPKRDLFRRIRSIRLPGRDLDDGKMYTLAISERLIQGESFILGATRCRKGVGCGEAGLLSRWPVQRSEITADAALRDYLRRLSQPVTPPRTVRLVPTR